MAITSFGPEIGGYVHPVSSYLRKFCREWMVCSVLAGMTLWCMGGVFNPLTFMVSLMLGVGFGLPVCAIYRFLRFTIGI